MRRNSWFNKTKNAFGSFLGLRLVQREEQYKNLLGLYLRRVNEGVGNNRAGCSLHRFVTGNCLARFYMRLRGKP